MTCRFLLDTHCWLWWNSDPDRLPPHALEVIANGENEILLSVVSAWEIAIKYTLGKLQLPLEPAEYIPSRLKANKITALPIHLTHTLEVSALPLHHRDPFDRLIISQARCEALTIITADRQFATYDVTMMK